MHSKPNRDPRRAYRVVDAFENELAAYCGAPYAVAVNSCTNSIMLALAYEAITADALEVTLPCRTYVGVLQAALNTGYSVSWDPDPWVDWYRLWPTRVVDSARSLKPDSYVAGTFTALSFHAAKQLPLGRGGAILTSDWYAAEWFRAARMDGRPPGQPIEATVFPGFHCPLSPDIAARGLDILSRWADRGYSPPPMEFGALPGSLDAPTRSDATTTPTAAYPRTGSSRNARTTMSMDLMPGPVTVCQLQSELEAVLDLYVEEQPQRVLEIGTASGGTLYWWLRYAQPDARIVTVDLPIADYTSSEHLYRDWTPDGVSVHQIRGDSRDPGTVDACRMLGPYQWLFIDGNHRYESAEADFENYGRMVEKGGIILFHDIALRRTYEDGAEAGVHRLWRELQAEGYWTREFRATPLADAYGIGALRV